MMIFKIMMMMTILMMITKKTSESHRVLTQITCVGEYDYDGDDDVKKINATHARRAGCA